MRELGKPDYELVVVNLAAVSSPAQCEADHEVAHRINTASGLMEALVNSCRATRFIQASTDQVFDGRTGFSREETEANPINAYGKTKFEMEKKIIAAGFASYVILRISFIYGPSPSDKPGPGGIANPGAHPSFLQFVTKQLGSGAKTDFWEDEVRSGVALSDVVGVFKDAVENVAWQGFFHVGGPDALSRPAFARRVAHYLELDASLVNGVPRASVIDPLKPPLSPLDISMNVDKATNALGRPFLNVEQALQQIYAK
eukprot:GEMP01063175.1.p1 GENE.GEMP01063175.1~~GEMP01063175.1.p1  ORF type:complete len:257 (+),score=59.15 GEMP01063175.1:252-1022(+)